MTAHEASDDRTPLLGVADAEPAATSVNEDEDGGVNANLSQAYLLGLISLLNTGLWIALMNLGSAGQEDPYVVMMSNAIGFSLSCPLALHGGAILNVLGLKSTVTLCTLPYPLYPLSLLYYARYGTTWPLILSSILCNICGGLKGATEGAIVLGYSNHRSRGQFISIFLTSVNIAPIIGGIINLVLNYGKDEIGRVSDATYVTFTILMALGTPVSLFLRSPEYVTATSTTPTTPLMRDTDSNSASSPPHPPKKYWTADIKQFYSLLLQPQYLLLLPVFITCGYTPGYISLFSTLYFTVRARSILGLISAVAYVTGATVFGRFSHNIQSRENKGRFGLQDIWKILWTGMGISWVCFLVLQLRYSNGSSKHHGGIDPASPLLFVIPAAVLALHRFALGSIEAFEWWVIGVAGEDGKNGEEGARNDESHEHRPQTEAVLDVARLAGVLRACDQVGAGAASGIGAAAESGGLNMRGQVGINIVLWAAVLWPTRKALRWMA